MKTPFRSPCCKPGQRAKPESPQSLRWHGRSLPYVVAGDVVMQEKPHLLAERGLARCQRLGVELDDASLRVEGCEQHRGKAGALRISTADFNGRLQVIDPGALPHALFTGVGHAKAFGCGLLMIRPIG